MRIVAGPKGTRVYRRATGRARKILTHVVPGEPVPEFENMSPSGLRRAEKRGEIVVDWDADDPLRDMAREEKPAAPPAPEKRAEDASLRAASSAPSDSADVDVMMLKTARGLTQHLTEDGKRTLCGQETKGRTVKGPFADGSYTLCSRCSSAAEA